jgi:hypothetical protein
LKIIANSCTSLLAKGFIFILAQEEENAKERERRYELLADQEARRGGGLKNQVSSRSALVWAAASLSNGPSGRARVHDTTAPGVLTAVI